MGFTLLPTPLYALLTLTGALIVVAFVHLLRLRYRPGLREIPGPFLASISDLDRLWSCAKGLQMNYHLALHRKYGPLVRVGPNHVSFADCSYIPTVYGINSKFYKIDVPSIHFLIPTKPSLLLCPDESSRLGKSDFYTMFDIKTPSGTTPSIFSVRDDHLHRSIRRPVANAYSLSTMKELEPMNDTCSAILMRKFEGFVGKDIDLGAWLHWYSFDVVTSITFSNTLGMMEQERDVENVIAAIEGRLIYNSIIGQAPYLDKYLFGNPIVAAIANLIPAVRIMNSARYITGFAAKQLERYNKQEFNTVPLKDMLDRFKRFKDEEQLIDDTRMLSHATSNILAGSDTTAASLRSLIHNLCTHPSAHNALLAELSAASAQNLLSDPITFAEAQRLPYLQAAIKESLRMHPAVGLLLERVVPPGGASFHGVRLPPGTIVGMNPWVSARDPATYGPDAGEFRPERWLEAGPERLRLMERNFLAFGAGARTCIGKNISLLEMSKLIPQLYRRFDFELTDPTRELQLHDYWFVKQTGLICKVKLR